MSRRGRRNRDHGGFVPGLIMIAVGVVFLFERFDMISTRQIWRLWPMLIIAIGLLKLLRPEGGRRSIFLLLLGIWLQISTLELFGLGFDDSWPLIIIFVGASFVFDALVSGGGAAPAWPEVMGPGGPPGSSGVREPAAPAAPREMSESEAHRGGGDE